MAVTGVKLTREPPQKGIKTLLVRHPLAFYFGIAYAFSWLAWMPLVLSQDGARLFSYPNPIGFYTTLAIASLGPSLAAFIMSGITEGRIGIGRLLRPLALWRVGLRWYLFALIGLPTIMLLSVIFLPGALASFQGLAGLAPLPTFALFAYVFFLGGPMGEEPGWRGFALPRLQRLYGPLTGSLILGPIWAFWHLPIFWIPTWNFPPTILNIVMFVSAAVAFTIILTWLFNNTKGSLLIAILAHTSFDLVVSILNGLFPIPIVNDYGSNVPVLIGLGVLAVVLVAATRGDLGYQRYRKEVADLADDAFSQEGAL